MKNTNFEKSEKNPQNTREIVLDKEASNELLRAVEDKKEIKTSIPVSKKPIEELLLLGDNEQNKLTCEEKCFILGIQTALTQQTDYVGLKIEINTESKKREEKKKQSISDKIEELKNSDFVDLESLENLEKLDINTLKNPNFEGYDISNLPASLRKTVGEIEAGKKGIIIVTPSQLLSYSGKDRKQCCQSKIDWVDTELKKIRETPYKTNEANEKEGVSFAIKHLIKDYTTYYSEVRGKVSKIYVIELSDYFTQNAAKKFIVLPKNNPEILRVINENAFFQLYAWLLLELAQNRRNKDGIKTQFTTPISERGEFITICQPLKDETPEFGTKENGLGLIKGIFTEKQIRKIGFSKACENISKWLAELKNKNFVSDFCFLDCKRNSIKETDKQTKKWGIKIVVRRIKNKNNLIPQNDKTLILEEGEVADYRGENCRL